MTHIPYIYRYVARFVIEAESPLAVGTGDGSILTDALVALDTNGLPFIPGTTLAGALRHALGEERAKTFFGCVDSPAEDDRRGSDIIITEARVIGAEGRVMDGALDVDFGEGSFYRPFLDLPIRQRVSINNRGVSDGGGKFDLQTVFKGTRFCFEIELLARGEERAADFRAVIDAVRSDAFRLGGSTREGMGAVAIRSLHTAVLDLRRDADLETYLRKPATLDDAAWDAWGAEEAIGPARDANFTCYTLCLRPDDFFLFGSGQGDDDADMTPARERFLRWDEATGLPRWADEAILIPATSVKGALAHRVAYYYNLLTGCFADDPSAPGARGRVGGANAAVRELFGYAASDGTKLPGRVLVSDVLVERAPAEKLLNHVAIDRFTGGSLRGALFSEKVVADAVSRDEYPYIIRLWTRVAAYSPRVVEAFERALRDVCTGMLPLGGGVNRGHGTFSGRLYKEGKLLEEI